MSRSDHPVVEAVRPAIEVTGGTLVAPDEAEALDVPIEWEGDVVAYARVLSNLVGRIEEELGAPLPDLDRTGKQVAVRLLDERGAFLLRRSIEDIADLMGVSRITIYNYLNAIRT